LVLSANQPDTSGFSVDDYPFLFDFVVRHSTANVAGEQISQGTLSLHESSLWLPVCRAMLAMLLL
jgi:hypothetical protein